MKIRLILILCCLYISDMGLMAQGIKFLDADWAKVMERAKKENKIVFIDCYTEWCQPCKKMEKETFTDKKVGDFFNKHFICVKVDMEKGEGPIILNMYKINSFPTLIFVNADGDEVFRRVGDKTVDELLKVGEEALVSKEVYPVNPQAKKQIELIGKKIPDFTYLDVNENKVCLSDLKGKYIYIDMWATWCRPCCEEIPYMMELEKKFHDKNICFVSLSCDNDKNAWKKKVKNDKMGGIQLNCGGDPEFMKFFGIQGIPHFILIDKNGKVMNPNMTRPSQDATVETLKRLKGI